MEKATLIVAVFCMFLLAMMFFSMQIMMLEAIDHFGPPTETETTTTQTATTQTSTTTTSTTSTTTTSTTTTSSPSPTSSPGVPDGYVYGAVLNAANEVLYQKKTPFFRISEYEPYYILGKIDVSDFKSASRIYFRITLYDSSGKVVWEWYRWISFEGVYSRKAKLSEINAPRETITLVVEALAYDNQWDVVATAKVSIAFPYGSYPF